MPGTQWVVIHICWMNEGLKDDPPHLRASAQTTPDVCPESPGIPSDTWTAHKGMREGDLGVSLQGQG